MNTKFRELHIIFNCARSILIVQLILVPPHSRQVSSVARGGGGARAPHWPVKYPKSHVFGPFETDFW